MNTRGFTRKQFIAGSAAAVGGFMTGSLRGQSPAPAPGAKTPKVMHVIGYSHIDAAWLWPWRDGADLALTTIRSALNRLKENPGMCYSHSSMAHYRWVQRADPAMFAEIQQRIREGRWEVVGGWPVEPDCNLPSTESFVRHCLYGQAYAQAHLGVTVRIGFNPDAFGHSAGLPTILHAAGYRYYAFQRPQEWEMNLPLLFWWEGPDGSRLLTWRIYQHYSAEMVTLPAAVANSFPPGFDHAAFFLGIGDHGGAVTKQEIRRLLEARTHPGMPELRWSTLQQFFTAVERSPIIHQLPVIRGELQHHSRGCYSANGEQKALNRRAERGLVQSETASLAALSIGHPYPRAEYAAAWEKVLFNQFHDLIAGTALYVDYQDSRDSLGGACDQALSAKVEALEAIAKKVDTSAVTESAVLLFNPFPWQRQAYFEYHGDPVPGLSDRITHLVSAQGQKIPLQWRDSDSMTPAYPRMAAWVDLPPCGYKVFSLAHGTPPAGEPFCNRVGISSTALGLASYRGPDGSELLSGPVGLVVIGDPSDTWAHRVDSFRHEIGRPEFVSSHVVEAGPVLRVTRQRARWRQSEIVLEIIESAGREAVELRFIIDWHEREQMLKLEIPTALLAPRILAKTAGAITERPPSGNEEPAQDWVAVQGRLPGQDQGAYTLGLVNAQTYSHDCKDGLLRTVLIRSAPYARHDPNQVPADDINAWQDQGRQERRFWLIAGRGSPVDLALDRQSDELQSPAEYVMDSSHPGTEPWEKSFLQVTPHSVVVLAVKADEQGSGDVILRLEERSGKPNRAILSGLYLQGSQSVTLGAFEIKTLRLRAGRVAAASLYETPSL